MGLPERIALIMTESRIIKLPVEAPPGLTPEKMLAFKLAVARKVRNKTQSDLGQAIGDYFSSIALSKDTIYRWEKDGNIPGCYLGAIASVLNIDFEFFRV